MRPRKLIKSITVDPKQDHHYLVHEAWREEGSDEFHERTRRFSSYDDADVFRLYAVNHHVEAGHLATVEFWEINPDKKETT